MRTTPCVICSRDKSERANIRQANGSRLLGCSVFIFSAICDPHSSAAPTKLTTELAICAVFIPSGVRDYLRVLPMSHVLGTLPYHNMVARIYSVLLCLLYFNHVEPDFITLPTPRSFMYPCLTKTITSAKC